MLRPAEYWKTQWGYTGGTLVRYCGKGISQEEKRCKHSSLQHQQTNAYATRRTQEKTEEVTMKCYKTFTGKICIKSWKRS